jgi:hypothetical protein
MTLTSLGRVNVASPGTPVALSTDPKLRVSKLFFQSVPGLTGKCYIGAPAMSSSALSQVTRVLVPATATAIADQFEISAKDGRDSIYLTQYAIDADVAGEGLLVSYWQE